MPAILIFRQFKRIRFHSVMFSGGFEFLFGGSENIDVFIFFDCVQLWTFGILLENHLLPILLDVRQFHSMKIFVLEKSNDNGRFTKLRSVFFSKNIEAWIQSNQWLQVRLEELFLSDSHLSHRGNNILNY